MISIDFLSKARDLDLSLNKEQREQFARYEQLLIEWNNRISLTAIREPESIRIKHFLDSMTCASVTGSLNGASLIDVGSGAGFPGLPLKILFPDLSLTLVDSVAKKCRFMETVSSELGLTQVTIVNGRAEEVGHDPLHRERYDWAVARAVAELRVLVEFLLPLVRVGGHAVAQKGASAIEEAAAARDAIAGLGGGETTISPVQLPGLNEPHYLVVIDKIAPTDQRFPRRPGIPAKRPL